MIKHIAMFQFTNKVNDSNRKEVLTTLSNSIQNMSTHLVYLKQSLLLLADIVPMTLFFILSLKRKNVWMYLMFILFTSPIARWPKNMYVIEQSSIMSFSIT